MVDWEASKGFEIGDIIEMPMPRSWWDIWVDRLTSLRWNVPMTEKHKFQCTSLSAGAMWPEVHG